MSRWLISQASGMVFQNHHKKLKTLQPASYLMGYAPCQLVQYFVQGKFDSSHVYQIGYGITKYNEHLKPE